RPNDPDERGLAGRPVLMGMGVTLGQAVVGVSVQDAIVAAPESVGRGLRIEVDAGRLHFGQIVRGDVPTLGRARLLVGVAPGPHRWSGRRPRYSSTSRV